MHKGFEVDSHNPKILKLQTVGFIFGKQEINNNSSAYGIGDNRTYRNAKYA